MADDLQLAEATQPLSFAEFLERMKDPRAADLVKSIKIFIKEFDTKPPDPEQDSQRVQDFLLKSEAAFRAHPVWASSPGEHQQQAIEGLEKYLMTKLYGKVFAASESDRERDEALARRMEALSFVRAEHLDIPAGHRDHTAWLLAMKELHKLNNYKAPRDKLVCILNCCRVINNLLHVGHDGDARGADDFLPVLIYVLVHANPPQLASNLMYIERFRMHSRMMSESAYFFTQLYSAASFIETINSGSLSMDPDEFVARMVAAGVADLPAASPRAGSQPAASPAFAAPAAENGAVLPPPAGQLPHPPATVSTAGGPLGEARPEFQSPRAPPAPPHGAAAQPVGEPALSPANSQQGIPGLSPMPAQPDANWTAAVPAAASQAPAPLAVPQQQQQQQQQQPPPLPPPPAQAGVIPTAWRAASVAEMEAEGGPLLLGAAQAGGLAARHPFLHTSPGDLRVGDVSQLLTAYKEAVLRYEALSLAVSARASAAASTAATAAAAPVQLPAVLQPPPPPEPEQLGTLQPALVPPPLAAEAMQQGAGVAAAPAQPPTAQAPAPPVTRNSPVDMPMPPVASAAHVSVAAPQPAEQQQQTAAPVDNPIFAAGSPASPAAEDRSPAQQHSEAASAAATAVTNIQDGQLSEYRTLPAEDFAAAGALRKADADAHVPPQADSAAESPQFIAAAAAAAAPVPDTQPAVSAAERSTAHPGAEQSGTAAAPSDSPHAANGSAVEADVDGAAEQDSPRDGLAAAAAALPEAADDEEAELAALEAELAAERAAVSAPVSEVAPSSEGPGEAISEEPPSPQEQNHEAGAAAEPQPAEPETGASAVSETAPSPAGEAQEVEPFAVHAAPDVQQATPAEDMPADPAAAVAASSSGPLAGDMHSSGETARQPQGSSMFEGLDMAPGDSGELGAAAPNAAEAGPGSPAAAATAQPGGEQSVEMPEGGSDSGAPEDAPQQGDSLI